MFWCARGPGPQQDGIVGTNEANTTLPLLGYSVEKNWKRYLWAILFILSCKSTGKLERTQETSRRGVTGLNESTKRSPPHLEDFII